MIFQESLGISIGDHQVSLVYVKGTLRGMTCAARGSLNLDPGASLNEKLHAAGLAVVEFLRENNVGNPSIYVGIPPSSAMFKAIEFPSAVRHNLGTTLTYELEKHIPISMEEIYFDHQIIGEAENSRISVLLAVVKRNDLQHYLDFCHRIAMGVNGIEMSSTAVANALIYHLKGKTAGDLGEDFLKLLRGAAPSDTSQSEPVSALMKTFDLPSEDLVAAFGLALKGMQKVSVDINLMPMEYRRRPSRTGHYAMMALAVLVLLSVSAWGASYWMHHKMVSGSLNAELKRLASEMAEITKIHGRIDAVEGQVAALNRLNAAYIPVSDILRELTQILPDTVWVREFSLGGGKIRLDGYADSAPDLISLLEASPIFKDVFFTSAIVKEKDGKERFNISMELESS
ncbi:PilN domain-containing protein [Desulfococcus sp.]|uniref:PilN domain-containing protein n=1 Tax=Desulfococcus sp. TaxID=2025834 RepID=UPI003593012C